MTFLRIFSIIVIITFACLHSTLSIDSSLRFVTAIWRHGDRAPTAKLFPADTGNGDSTWPQGLQELTERGMQQHAYLGGYLRKRYVDDKGFLSGDYKAKEIYVRSTSYNRTIMSALSNLAGMYPRKANAEIFNDSNWQPIPVHSQPRETDPMLWMDCPCPTVDKIYTNEVLKSHEVKKIEHENKDFLEFLRINTGLKSVGLNDVWDIWDPLNCERLYPETHKWPTFMNESIFERLTILMDLSTSFYYHDPKIQRFRGAMVFNEIAIRMDQKAHRPKEIQPPTLKYYVYSAHDTTLSALLENLGAYNNHLPEYASALLFELHEKQPGKFTVETWYVNVTLPPMNSTPVRIVVQDCDTPGLNDDCTLEKFLNKSSTNVPTDWYEECGVTKKNNP